MLSLSNLLIAFMFLLLSFSGYGHASAPADLSRAAIVLSDEVEAVPARTAQRVLREEIARRTGLTLAAQAAAARDETRILLQVEDEQRALDGIVSDGFSVTTDTQGVVITGASPRGLLFGAGYFLRHMTWGEGRLGFSPDSAVATRPTWPIRGHQLGYRDAANSYDAWDDKQYEQYIRELALFGVNSIENIPFQDERLNPLMPLDRLTMNRRMSEICRDYGLDFWVWTPAVFNLEEAEERAAHLDEHEQMYATVPTLTAVFFPGGDPGANPPELVLPFLEDLAIRLRRHHPEAKVWLSLQWFNDEQCEDIHRWIDQTQPDWFGGLVAGPGSPPIAETRARLNSRYPLRHYPDITHTVRCQYPVHWWDPAFAFTLGREPINPQPVFYAFIHNAFADYTDGFLTYSDGMNDDINKIIWSLRGWNPDADVRDMLKEYARLFFNPDLDEPVADAILALEKNWEGPLAENGGVSATLSLWQRLEAAHPELQENWRWQSLLVRAYYDAYTRYRLLYETALEEEANALLARARELGPAQAMTRAMAILERAVETNCRPDLHKRILELFDALFHSIGLQSSVPKYHASGYERGCSLDFLDYPLNNRWWLEDRFETIRALDSESAQIEALEKLAAWTQPGDGSFYDAVGHVGLSPRVKRSEGLNTDPLMQRSPNPGPWWWDQGFSRERLAWQMTQSYPITMVYWGLDPDAQYLLRMTGRGNASIRANGKALTPETYSTGLGEFKEYLIPRPLSATGELTLIWDAIDESHLNWREHSFVAEVWLLKQ